MRAAEGKVELKGNAREVLLQLRRGGASPTFWTKDDIFVRAQCPHPPRPPSWITIATGLVPSPSPFFSSFSWCGTGPAASSTSFPPHPSSQHTTPKIPANVFSSALLFFLFLPSSTFYPGIEPPVHLFLPCRGCWSFPAGLSVDSHGVPGDGYPGQLDGA